MLFSRRNRIHGRKRCQSPIRMRGGASKDGFFDTRGPTEDETGGIPQSSDLDTIVNEPSKPEPVRQEPEKQFVPKRADDVDDFKVRSNQHLHDADPNPFLRTAETQLQDMTTTGVATKEFAGSVAQTKGTTTSAFNLATVLPAAVATPFDTLIDKDMLEDKEKQATSQKDVATELLNKPFVKMDAAEGIISSVGAPVQTAVTESITDSAINKDTFSEGLLNFGENVAPAVIEAKIPGKLGTAVQVGLVANDVRKFIKEDATEVKSTVDALKDEEDVEQLEDDMAFGEVLIDNPGTELNEDLLDYMDGFLKRHPNANIPQEHIKQYFDYKNSVPVKGVVKQAPVKPKPKPVKQPQYSVVNKNYVARPDPNPFLKPKKPEESGEMVGTPILIKPKTKTKVSTQEVKIKGKTVPKKKEVKARDDKKLRIPETRRSRQSISIMDGVAPIPVNSNQDLIRKLKKCREIPDKKKRLKCIKKAEQRK